MADRSKMYKDIEARRKNAKMATALYGVGYMVALGCYFVSATAMIFVIVANLALYYLLLRPQIKRFENESKKELALEAYSSYGTNLQYALKGSFTREEIKDTGLIWWRDSKDGFLSREMVSGTHQDLPFRHGDISVIRRVDAKGELDKKKRLPMMMGSWLEVRYPHSFPAYIRIMSQGALPEEEVKGYLDANPSLETLGGVGEKFAQKFQVLTNDRSAAASVLTPEVTGKILRLAEACPNMPMLIGFQGEKLHIFLSKRFVAPYIQMKFEITPENTPVDQMPELVQLFQVVDEIYGQMK